MTKRILDLILVVAIAPLAMLAFAIVGYIIKKNLGAPILFRQTRPGLNGKPFQMIKFRTMRNISDEQGNLLPDCQRMTRLGEFLRASSLDELPELWNVFKGDMSLVGPRPLLMEYLPLYNSEQFRRHEVRPGITGWAQINGRNEITWEDKFKLDIWYVDNRSIWLDIKIMCRTIRKVLRKDGINETGQATVSKFTGKN